MAAVINLKSANNDAKTSVWMMPCFQDTTWTVLIRYRINNNPRIRICNCNIYRALGLYTPSRCQSMPSAIPVSICQYVNNTSHVSNTCQSVSGTFQYVCNICQRVSNTCQYVSNTCQYLINTCQSVSNTCQSVNGTYQYVSNTSQYVSNTCQPVGNACQYVRLPASMIILVSVSDYLSTCQTAWYVRFSWLDLVENHVLMSDQALANHCSSRLAMMKKSHGNRGYNQCCTRILLGPVITNQCWLKRDFDITIDRKINIDLDEILTWHRVTNQYQFTQIST